MRLRLFLPILLLVLVAVGWSAFWFYAAHEAGRQIDRFIVQQARAGTQITCANRSIGGYPFRLELRCGASSIAAERPDNPFSVSAAGLAAVVQLPNPNLLIFELASPLTVKAPDGTTITAAFKAFRSSVSAEDGAFRRTSVQVEQPALTATAADGTEVAAVEGQLLDVFVRKAESGAPGAYDLLAKLTDAKSPLSQKAMGGDTATVELQMEATGIDAFAEGVTPDSLRAFSEAGGTLHLVLLRGMQGDVVAEARGDATLDAEGLPNGALDVTVVNTGKLVQALGEKGVTGLYSALALGQSAKLDGKPAQRYALRLDAGRLSVGSVSLARFPSLF